MNGLIDKALGWWMIILIWSLVVLNNTQVANSVSQVDEWTEMDEVLGLWMIILIW